MRRSARLAAVAAATALAISACGDDDATVESSGNNGSEENNAAETAEDTEADVEEETDDAGDEPTDEAGVGDDEEETGDAGDDTTDDTAQGDGDVPPLEDVWAEAIDAAQAADQVDMSIVGTVDGMDMDLRVRGALDDSEFGVTGAIDGSEVEIVYIDGSTYMYADQGFWDEAGVPEDFDVADQWLIVPDEVQLTDSFSVGALWDDFVMSMPTDSVSLETSEATLTDLDGTSAYHYTLANEDAQIWIAEESSQLLRMEASQGDEEMTIDFAAWDDEVEAIEEPEDATPMEELVGG